MKRRAMKLFVLLFVGAIINIAVAFAFGAFADARTAPEQFNITHDPGSGIWISDTRRDALGISQSIRRKFSPSSYGVAGHAYILEFDMMKAQPTVLAPGEHFDVDKEAATNNSVIIEPWLNSYGYPMRSMCCWLENQSGYPSSNAMSRTGDVRVIAGVDLSKNSLGPDAHMLPLRPLWHGFVINTIFYTAIVWLLFTAPIAIRRRIRIKRGQCASCGYDLQSNTSNLCPECGAAV
jgi:hypothetical protein